MSSDLFVSDVPGRPPYRDVLIDMAVASGSGCGSPQPILRGLAAMQAFRLFRPVPYLCRRFSQRRHAGHFLRFNKQRALRHSHNVGICVGPSTRAQAPTQAPTQPPVASPKNLSETCFVAMRRHGASNAGLANRRLLPFCFTIICGRTEANSKLRFTKSAIARDEGFEDMRRDCRGIYYLAPGLRVELGVASEIGL